MAIENRSLESCGSCACRNGPLYFGHYSPRTVVKLAPEGQHEEGGWVKLIDDWKWRDRSRAALEMRRIHLKIRFQISCLFEDGMLLRKCVIRQKLSNFG